MAVSIALFTRDLRVHDNPVLAAAAGDDQCIPLFVLDDAILNGPFNRPNRAAFLVDSLRDLDQGLARAGGRLVVRRGRLIDEVLTLVREHSARSVHVAADVSAFARRREDALREALDRENVDLHVHECSITAVPPGSLTPSGGGKDHFAVFTPYFRRWSEVTQRAVIRPPRRLSLPALRAGGLPAVEEICAGERSPHLAAGGEGAGRRLLTRWVNRDVREYEHRHDDLAGDGTSRLSPHLHFGTVSVTELLDRTGSASSGAQAFTRQLAWRDFHHQVLAARPECATRDYRPRGDRWRRSDRDFTAWREGRTGFPIVDAAMRQLADEGWMHNRARLIVASFLTKTLYLDWRLGARHFADLLVDADTANNQMNWQWSAGTGTDTRPNRILNPLRQAERYDPGGDYVRKYVPELSGIPGGAVHEPWKLPRHELQDTGYPARIVDLRGGAERFKDAREESKTSR
ncbi:cryptochrome/photolyase family protein [Amycolatopsis saalfeldensis]|uniref:Deoxyribodipyrimidine photo-lyase n=1 Tax=Amycolatopsis saalfeldensis TaxID=394193 RepID=A0A1H8YRC7_9PSEU|nr:deoxyribodipyrimidine photo-lyase [Amycolatopsis saalfeldensis]SEP53928.1 deoxyribodipyrimidine photo-lyase [Amycolatopsis saalfeldensis]